MLSTRMLTALAAASLLISLPAGATTAEPSSTTVGLLPLQIDGKLPPQGAEQLGTAVDEGLKASGAAVIPPDQLQTALNAPLNACTDPACVKSVASKFAATHLVRPSVTLVESDYVLTIEVIDGATGNVVHRGEKTCELCGLSEAVATMELLVGSVEGSLAPIDHRGTLEITSDPVGASVLLDGEPVGVTPLSVETHAGEHQILLREGGFVDRELMVVLEPEQTEQITAALDPAGPRKRRGGITSERTDRLLRIGAWTSLGLGIASLGSGIALLVIDETPVSFTRCSGNDVDAMGNCRFRHKTLGGGVAMTVLGVVGITAGTILLVRDRKRRGGSDQRARLRPTSSGLALHF